MSIYFILSALGLCVLFQISQAVPAPGHGDLVGYCLDGVGCADGECCISFNTPKGKRAVGELSPDLRQFVNGKCEKLGTDGSECFVRPLMPDTSGLHYTWCPCFDGLYCDGNGVSLPPLGESGVCKPIGRQHCFTSKDCKKTECCVSNVRPLGKRSTDSISAPGHCGPMGTQGSTCLVQNGSRRQKTPVFHSCPCYGFLRCQGIDHIDLQLGAVGMCSRRGYWPFVRN